MKISDLPPDEFDRLKVLSVEHIPQIVPESGRHIVYRHGHYDGVLSGAIRWNGGLFLFKCIAQEEDMFEWPLEHWDALADGEESIEATRDCKWYYAVTVHSDAYMRHVIRRHVSFATHVNPHSDYRKKKYKFRVMRPGGLPGVMEYVDSWMRLHPPPAQSEDYDGTIVAWFRL